VVVAAQGLDIFNVAEDVCGIWGREAAGTRASEEHQMMEGVCFFFWVEKRGGGSEVRRVRRWVR